jgi:putative ABC transport system permease protein
VSTLRDAMPGTFTDLVPVTGARSFNLALPGSSDAQNIAGELVTDRYFATYGVELALGRAFQPNETAAPGVPVTILGYDLWQERFGGRRDVLGKSILLNEGTYTIVGVAPRNFRGFSDGAGLWLPMGMSNRIYGPHYTEMRQFRWLRGVARLAPGVSVASAGRALDATSRNLRATYTENDKYGFAVQGLTDVYFGSQRRSLLSMFGAAAFVLLIGCANIANLLLARALARRREMALRVALGAGRARLVRQALAESVVLGACGLAAGLLLAVAGAKALVASGAMPLLSFTKVSIDPTVIAASVALTMLCVLGFGGVPAIVALRIAPKDGLGDGTRSATAGRARQRLQRTLIGAEVALATLLLAGASLMAKGFGGFQRTDLGFRAADVASMRIDLTAERYKSNDAVWSLLSRLRDEMRGMTGIRSAAFEGPGFPTGGWYLLTVAKPDARPGDEPFPARRHNVTPGYFATLGIPLKAGRDFSSEDVAGGMRNIVIGSRLAAKLWPGESAIGKELRTVGGTPVPLTVVGVVADVEHSGRQTDSQAQDDIYISAFQSPPRSPAMLTLFVQSNLPPTELQTALQSRLRAIDPYLPLFDVQSMQQRLDAQTATARMLVWLMIAFATLGLVLAAVGVFGVISYSVVQRTREIGVRLALGATPSSIRRQVVGSALVPVVAGLATGMIGVWVAGRFVTALLYGVAPSDPAILAGTTVALLLVASLASWWPARVASSVPPMLALRSE